MNWCYYEHNVTFNFDYVLTWFNDYFALYLTVKQGLFLIVWKLLGYKCLSKLLQMPQTPPTITWGPWNRDPQYEG